MAQNDKQAGARVPPNEVPPEGGARYLQGWITALKLTAPEVVARSVAWLEARAERDPDFRERWQAYQQGIERLPQSERPLSQVTLSRLLHGHERPKASTLIKLAAALDITPAELQSPPPSKPRESRFHFARGRTTEGATRYLGEWMAALNLTASEVARRSLVLFEQRKKVDPELRKRLEHLKPGQRLPLADTPLHYKAVRSLLRGGTSPHMGTMQRLAEALGIPLEKLLRPPSREETLAPLSGWAEGGRAGKESLR